MNLTSIPTGLKRGNVRTSNMGMTDIQIFGDNDINAVQTDLVV